MSIEAWTVVWETLLWSSAGAFLVVNAYIVLGALFGHLKRFQEKWNPVFRPKTRQNEEREPGFDSIETEKALAARRRERRP